jgi:hypothetical protein
MTPMNMLHVGGARGRADQGPFVLGNANADQGYCGR